MSATDPVETETAVFTEEEVHMIGGFLAELWGRDEDSCDDVDDAIRTVLSRVR